MKQLNIFLFFVFGYLTSALLFFSFNITKMCLSVFLISFITYLLLEYYED